MKKKKQKARNFAPTTLVVSKKLQDRETFMSTFYLITRLKPSDNTNEFLARDGSYTKDVSKLLLFKFSEQALERAEKETVLMGIHSYVTYFDFDPKKITEQNKNDDSKAVN